MSHTDLNEVEFGTVFALDNGNVIEHHEHIAPDVTHDPDGDVQVDGGWSCITGYTGQYSYHGAVMHPSEYLGGRMADAMRDPDVFEPGTLFAVVEVRDDTDADDLIGWAVAYRNTHQ